jgi:probable HAF family extracellular repeat protein
MKRILLGALACAGLNACEDLARPVEPAPPTEDAAVVAGDQQFTVRSLGTLGGTFSGANAINELGEVAGFADLPSGEARAILWRPGQGMRSLGSLGGAESRARGINDRTEVVGFSQVRPGSDVVRAFLWSEAGGMHGLGTLGGRTSVANGINNRREVVGTSDLANGHTRAFLWRPGSGMRSLGTLGGANSDALDLNDATQVVGFSETADGQVHAFLWTAGHGMEDLGTLGGSTSQAFGISQTGAVVGTSTTAQGREKAFLWTRERGMRSLGVLDGQARATGTSVNTHGRVVGVSFAEDEELDLPFFWVPGNGIQRLPDLGGDRGQAQDLNEFGQIVGTTRTGRNAVRATLWTPTAGPLVARTSASEGGPARP